jgi:hypothetical protein
MKICVRASRLIAVVAAVLASSLILSSGAWAELVSTEAELVLAANSDTPQVIDLANDITVHSQVATTFNWTLNGGNHTIFLDTPVPSEGEPAPTTAAPLFGSISSTSVIEGLNISLNESASDGVSGRGILANSADAGSTINDVHAAGAVTSGEGMADSIGGLIGINSGTIANSSADVKVFGPSAVGGLVGTNYGSIENSIATGGAAGNNSVGGLVGYNLGSILNSASQGYASGTNNGETRSDSVGGLVGWNDVSGTILNSMANTRTDGEGNNFGGLVGWNDGLIENSLSLGATSSTGTDGVNIAGLVGWSDGIINNSVSQGSVISEWDYVGGLVGTNYGMVENSLAISNVTSFYGSTLGGLVASNFGTILNSFAGGAIKALGGHIAGGLVGSNRYGGSISTSGSKSSVLGLYTVGGLVGFNEGQISESWSSVGTVSGENEVGGLVGFNIGDIADSLAYGDVTSTESPRSSVGTLVGSQYELRFIVINSNSYGNAGEGILQIGNVSGWTGAGTPTRLPGPHFEFTSDEILLNSSLTTKAWDKKTGINSEVPYLINMLGKGIYQEPAPRYDGGSSDLRTEIITLHPGLPAQKIAEQKITEFLTGGVNKLTPSDFKVVGISGVTSLNLPILLKLLKDLGLTSFDKAIILNQIRIANALLARQKKSRSSKK